MGFILGAIKVIFVLGFLIFIHEGGHFLVAKACKVNVREFALGFGPKLISKTKNGTKYTLRAIPLGGFVDMLGENNRTDEPGAFCTSPVWKRILIVIAGATVNIVFGIIVYFSLMAIVFNQATTTIESILPEYAAEGSVLEPNDTIKKIDGKDIKIKYELDLYIYENNQEKVNLEVIRNGEVKSLDYTLKKNSETGRYMLGVKMKPAEATFKNRIYYGYMQTNIYLKELVKNIASMFKGHVKAEEMVGPIGISGIIVKTKGISDFVYFLSIISLSLGFSNLLPIPALDGGKLLILIIEAIRRKPMKEETEIKIQMLGFSFIIFLSLYISFNDVMRLL